MKGRITKTGYRRNSPDVSNDFNIIPSNRISMRDVDFPVLGIDNLGNTQLMHPGGEYEYQGDYVTELPMYGSGGLTQWFAEEWVDIKTGKKCGRSGKDKKGRPYPACRPSKRVNKTTPKTKGEMSAAEKARFKKNKKSGKRIDYNHKRELGGTLPSYQTKGETPLTRSEVFNIPRTMAYEDGKMVLQDKPIWDGMLDEVTITPYTQNHIAFEYMMNNKATGGLQPVYPIFDLMTLGLKAPVTAGAKAIQTGIKKLPSKINPNYYNPNMLAKGNPNIMYREVGKDAFQDFADSGFLRTKAEITDNPILGLLETQKEIKDVLRFNKEYRPSQYRHATDFRAPFFSRGKTTGIRDGGADYLIQTRPDRVGPDKFLSAQWNILHGKQPPVVGGFGIMDPMYRSADMFDVFKKSWWHGYKPVKELGGSLPKAQDGSELPSFTNQELAMHLRKLVAQGVPFEDMGMPVESSWVSPGYTDEGDLILLRKTGSKYNDDGSAEIDLGYSDLDFSDWDGNGSGYNWFGVPIKKGKYKYSKNEYEYIDPIHIDPWIEKTTLQPKEWRSDVQPIETKYINPIPEIYSRKLNPSGTKAYYETSKGTIVTAKDPAVLPRMMANPKGQYRNTSGMLPMLDSDFQRIFVKQEGGEHLVGEGLTNKINNTTAEYFINTEKEQNEKFNRSKSFLEGWTNSLMHDQMLSNSLPGEQERITRYKKGRLQNIQSIPGLNIQYEQPKNRPDWGAVSLNSTGEIIGYPQGFNANTVYTHEITHSSDRPLNQFNNRLIPESDINLMQEYFTSNNRKSPFAEYVAKPYETRARLMEIRDIARQKAIYDPYSEKLSKEAFNEFLINHMNEDLKSSKDFKESPLIQLNQAYTEDQIFNMLNGISANNVEEGEFIYAQNGGSLPSYQTRGEVNFQSLDPRLQNGYNSTDATYVAQNIVDPYIATRSETQRLIDENNQQTISSYVEPSTAEKLVNRLANPFTTAGYVVRGQQIPDRVAAKDNVFDMASDVINPAAYLEAGNDAINAFGDGNVIGGALSTAGALPFFPGGLFKKGSSSLRNTVIQPGSRRLERTLYAPNKVYGRGMPSADAEMTTRFSLVEQYNARNNAYHTVNITDDLRSNEYLRERAKVYGYNPDSDRDLALFLGSSPGGTGRRTGYEDLLPEGYDFLYSGNNPIQTLGRYGDFSRGSTPYTTKFRLFNDNTSMLSDRDLFERIQALDGVNTNRPDFRMGPISTFYPGDDISKLVQGNIVNTNTLHVPGLNQTNIMVGRVNTPVRQPVDIRAGSEMNGWPSIWELGTGEGTFTNPSDYDFYFKKQGGEQLPKAQEGNGEKYTVGSGETFYGIANKSGVAWEDLVSANPGIDIEKLSVGQIINVPSVSKSGGIKITYSDPELNLLQQEKELGNIKQPELKQAEEIKITKQPVETKTTSVYDGPGYFPEALLLKQAYKESTFNPAAKSNIEEPAQGFAQFRPITVRELQRLGFADETFDPFDYTQSIGAQRDYMNYLYARPWIDKPNQSEEVRLAKTLAAYNWGPEVFKTFLTNKKAAGVDIYNSLDWVDELPKETGDYVNKILLDSGEQFQADYQKAIKDPTNSKYINLYNLKAGGESIPVYNTYKTKNRAWLAARKNLGANKKFMYGGKVYSTSTPKGL